MFTPIHRALGLQPGPFDLDLLHRAVDGRVQEATDLDWKQSVYHTNNPGWRDEAAKDMAAMANAGGGWIVFGVADEDDRASEAIPVAWGPGEEQRLRQVSFARVTPAILGIEFHVVSMPEGEGALVGMRVPATHEAPHFSRVGEGPHLVCPKRDGSHTVFMAERDIERAYRDRFERRTEWRGRLDDLRDEALSTTDFSTHVGSLAVAIPREQGEPRALTDREAMTVLAEARYNPLYEEASHYPCLPHEQQVRPGYRSMRFIDNVKDASVGACTLHQDGSVGVTMHLGRLGLANDRTPDTAASHWVFKAVADFIRVVVAHARHCGQVGSYGATFEMLGPAPFYIEPGRSHPLSLQRRGDLTPVLRFIPVSFEVNPQASDDELLALAKVVAMDVMNQAGLSDLGLAALTSRW